VLLDEAEASLQDSSLDLLHESERLGIAGCLPWCGGVYIAAGIFAE
jgi:hypothetical protein